MIDGLCNPAGLRPLARSEAAVLQVNRIRTRAFTGAMCPHMKSEASIVNMASRAGHGWRENLGQNNRLAALPRAAKAGQSVSEEGIDATRCHNLTKEAIIPWEVAISKGMIARGIRMNSLGTGGISSALPDDFKRGFAANMARSVERAGRSCAAQEIADMVAFGVPPEGN